MSLTWTPQGPTMNWFRVASSSDGTKLVATVNGGQIYTSTDSGVTWTPRNSNRAWEIVASSSDGTKLFATDDTSRLIYTSTDSGVTWYGRHIPLYRQGIACSADGTKVVAAVYGGQIYTSTDSGVTWTPRATNRNWQDVASSADGTKLVVTVYGGQIYTSTDSGATWVARESNRTWKGVASSSDGTQLVACVTDGQIYTSTDSGATWVARESNRAWRGVASSSDGTRLVAVAFDDKIYTSTDSGATWTASESNREWRGVASSSNGTRLVAVAPGYQIYTTQIVLYTTPSPPTGVSAVAGNKSATVSWTAPASNGGDTITKYTVTSSPGGFTATSTSTKPATPTTSATVTGLTAGTSYTFTVTATNAQNLTSAASTASSAVTAYDVPGAPTGLILTPGNTQIAASWTAPSANGSPITKYTLYDSTNAVVQDNIATTSYTKTGLTNGTSYTYYVKAYNTGGYGAASSSVSATPITTPSAPATPSTVSGDTDITVSWVAPANGGSAITGYKLRYSSNGGSTWGSAISVGNVLTYNVTGLTDNTNYQFQVAATNAAGDSAWSTATASVQTVTTPSAPQIISLTAEKNAIKVDWKAPDWQTPANNGGSAITGYTIRYRVQGSGVALTEIDNISPQNTSSTKTYTITGLTGGSLYDVYVYAFNAVDAAKQGAAAYDSATPFDVPDAPTNLQITPTLTSFNISWTVPSNNRGAAITNYKISWINGVSLATGGTPLTYEINSTQTSYTINDVNPYSSAYGIQVTAKNSAGYSTALAQITNINNLIPSSPENLAIVPGLNNLQVNWSAPVETGGSSILKYKLTWIDSASLITGGTSQTLEVNSDVLSYTLSNLSSSLAYIIQVQAKNSTGYSVVIYGSETPLSIIPPEAPQNVSSTSGNGSVVIAFTPTTNSNGGTINSYTVTGINNVTNTNITSVTSSNTPTAISSITITGLTNGQQYTFSIRATNAAGTGSSATTTAIPISPTATSIDTSSIVVANVAEAAQVVESISAASTAVIEQVAAATIEQVKGSDAIAAASAINAAITSEPVRQAVAKAAGAAAISLSVSTSVTAGNKINDYKGRITTVRNSAASLLPTLKKEAVQGASKAILSTNEPDEIKLASTLITGNSEEGADRLTMKDATVTAIEETYAGTSTIVSGDVLTALKASIPVKTAALENTTSMRILVTDPNTRTLMLPVNGTSVYIPMISNIEYSLGNAAGSETIKLVFNAVNNTMTKGNMSPLSAGDKFVLNGIEYPLLGIGSAPIGAGSIPSKPVEVNLNVQIDASGDITILSQTGPSVSNIVIPTKTLPIDCLYDSFNNIGLIEFWEPEDRDTIECRLATSFTSGTDAGYKITAKKLALGLQNLLVGPLDASGAMPFSDARYTGATAHNNRKMNGFGRLALMAYAHYIMGHVQATAAITNDSTFIKNMLSLNSNTSTANLENIQPSDYAYAAIGNYDANVSPWNVAGSTGDANLAVRLVNALITANVSGGSETISTSATGSTPAASSVANIVKQVIGQDASRARGADNSKYTPDVKGLLKFIAGDVIYVSILLIAPNVSVGAGQRVGKTILEGLYAPTTGDNKYTLKITLA